jgi:hypothetical protein
MGTIRLVMRGQDDGDVGESEGANATDMFGGKRPDWDAHGQTASAFGAPANATASAATTATTNGSAPAAGPTSGAPASGQPWTMVLLKGSEMDQVTLTSDRFPVIQSQAVDYQPDPPAPPAAPPEMQNDSDSNSDDGVTLTQPTAFDEGFGDEQSAGPND